THPWVTAAIGQAQKRVELQNFQARKKLLQFDDVMNQQREVIYSQRLYALEGGEELKAEAQRMIESAIEHHIDSASADYADHRREGIYYRAWGQKDPLVEYKQEAFEMFMGLMHDLQTTFAERWLKLQIEIGPPPSPGQGGQRPPSRGVTGPAGGLPGARRRETPMVASKPAADGLVTSGEPPPPSVQRSAGGVAEPAFVANPY